MEQDAIVSETSGVEEKHFERPMSRRRLTLPSYMWTEVGDAAEKMDLSIPEYIERLHNSHIQKDSDLQMRDKIIENMELTIKMYRKVLKEAGIPIDGFVEGD